MNTRQKARCLEAAEQDARFDWDEWNRQFDTGMDELKAHLDRWAQIERELDELHVNLARDLREHFTTEGGGMVRPAAAGKDER